MPLSATEKPNTGRSTPSEGSRPPPALERLRGPFFGVGSTQLYKRFPDRFVRARRAEATYQSSGSPNLLPSSAGGTPKQGRSNGLAEMLEGRVHGGRPPGGALGRVGAGQDVGVLESHGTLRGAASRSFLRRP